MTAIPAEVAAELYEATDGMRVGEWTRVADQRVGSGRWTEQHWLVLTRGDGFFGLSFARGLTESQENELPWAPSWGTTPTEVILTPLVAVPVTTTKYLTEKQYERHLAKAATDG